MRLLTLLTTLLISSAAYAEPPHSRTGDTIEIRQCNPWPCVYYHNVAGKQSHQGYYVRTWNGNDIKIHIEVGEAETITIMPPEGITPEVRQADVLDGEDIYINLIVPVS